MSAHTALLIARWKFMRRGVVEQQERTKFTAHTVVIKYGADRETIAHPVHARTLMDAK
jgi:hypothetical protein